MRPGPYGLDVFHELLRRLGDPHRALTVVHVAGTRGKGSTSALLSSALHAAGLRAGLTTSPHLLHPRERIRIGERDMDEAAFLALVEEVHARAGELDASFFETIIAASFVAFARERVDVAVVEVGLGGRLDATNVVAPAVAVVTRLGRDHADRLGPTAESVAYEKAGILKRGVRAVLAPNPPAAAAVVRRRASELGVPLRVVRSADVEAAPPTALPGAAQRENAATARAALEELGLATGGRLEIPAAALRQGFAAVRWPCRLELLPAGSAGAPDLLVDVAHDLDGVQALVAHLGSLGRRPAGSVFTCLSDKNLAGMAKLLAASPATRQATWFVPELPGPRARPAAEVARTLAEAGLETRACENVSAALAGARGAAGPGGLALAFGSFLVAEAVLRALRSCP